MFFYIAIIFVIFALLNDKSNDMEMRESARQKGLEFYPSSTGLRFVSDNRPYRIHDDGWQEPYKFDFEKVGERLKREGKI